MKKLLIIYVTLSLFSACDKGNDMSEEEVILKHVVIQYNTLLADGYRNLNMSQLTKFATRERAQKAYYHMAALGEGRQKMDAKLNNISFSSVTIMLPDTSEVKTIEEWDYTHINIDTNEVVLSKSEIYENTYVLTKDKDTWLVKEITVNKEVKKE